MEQLSQLDKSIIIATKAHSGDVDKGGKHYIFHAMRVAMNVDKVRKYPVFHNVSDEVVEKVYCVCFLHDTIEDTKNKPNPITFDVLRAEGIDEEIIEGVDGMTRREDETYRAFIERSMLNILSRMGKACDLLDNMDESRLLHCSIEEQAMAKERIKKRYKPSLKRVLGEDDQTLIDLVTHFKDESTYSTISRDQIHSFVECYKENTLELTTTQAKAIHMALQSNISVLAGFAGSGVTETLIAMIQCLNDSKVDAKIYVFSGTEKNRLVLTRRLNMGVKNVHHIKDEVLTGDLLVIHEPEVMDRSMLIRLLQKAQNIKILFVTDFQQLPRKDAVNLQDLVTQTSIPVTILKEKLK
ncbi:AAA family ATPase [Brevibacillus sp. NPDC058079]|uniref:AAA family ATPase n=1 Tax=Brevibacillus sp. NPDC058079 TaxID=3346330 RepID=UPI0036E42250